MATAIGPLLGGWLVDVASWRWVFLINLPLAVVVVWLAWRHVPESHDPGADGTPVDWAGGLLGAVALAGGTYALIEAGAGSLAVTVAVVAGVVGVVAFVLRERSAPYPVLPFPVFASAQFSAANAVTFLAYGGLGVVFFLLVVQLQVAAGFGPVAAGSALLPVTVIMLAAVGAIRGAGLPDRAAAPDDAPVRCSPPSASCCSRPSAPATATCATCCPACWCSGWASP